MIFNSKYGYIYIFSKNNAFVLNDNNYNLNIFIKELNKYIIVTTYTVTGRGQYEGVHKEEVIDYETRIEDTKE